MTLIREQLRQTLVDEEDAGQLTSAGRKALERFRKCKAGDQPRVSSLWCSAVAKMVHAGLEAKDKPAGALANAGDLQSGVGGGTAGVQFPTPPELEEELASLRAKMSGKMSDVLSIQTEPKRAGGTKGAGIYYDGTRPLERRLGNYRDHGAKVISRTSWGEMSPGQDKYVLTLHSHTEDLCDRWEKYRASKGISKAKLGAELEHKKQLVIDANPRFANNFLALLNEPDATEEANVEMRDNGDFYFVGTQYQAGFLLVPYNCKTTVYKKRSASEVGIGESLAAVVLLLLLLQARCRRRHRRRLLDQLLLDTSVQLVLLLSDAAA